MRCVGGEMLRGVGISPLRLPLLLNVSAGTTPGGESGAAPVWPVRSVSYRIDRMRKRDESDGGGEDQTQGLQQEHVARCCVMFTLLLVIAWLTNKEVILF